MTVYGFVKKCMSDDEFNRGGIVSNERKWLDSIGFEYLVKDGQVCEDGADLKEFYRAMETIRELHIKYSKKA